MVVSEVGCDGLGQVLVAGCCDPGNELRDCIQVAISRSAE
jgi:hypothetical protein